MSTQRAGPPRRASQASATHKRSRKKRREPGHLEARAVASLIVAELGSAEARRRRRALRTCLAWLAPLLLLALALLAGWRYDAWVAHKKAAAAAAAMGAARGWGRS